VLHTATLLKDGRVLIAGGVGPRSGEDYLASAEIYDPVTGQFSAAGSLPSPRVYNTATLLPSGLVLIAGGWSASSSTSQVFSECYLYDPANQRSEHTATLLLDGRVLVVGGGTGSADIYDPATGRFSPTGSLMTGYGTNTATLLKDGRVLTANVGMLPLTAELYWP
jgi:N-acetylneuraminic acid mutarotase